MKALFILAGLVISLPALAAHQKAGCYAYGRSYAAGESDCDGRVCREDGTWQGVVKSGICDVKDSGEKDEVHDSAASKEKQEEKSPE